MDDYGHHPTEIQATVEAVRSGWKDKRLVMVFQPHRYTRTRDLYEDFAKVLAQVDILIIMQVYAAGEAPIAGADSRSLCRTIRQHGRIDPIFVEDEDDIKEALSNVVRDGDLIVTQGAGNVGGLAVGWASENLEFIKK